MLDAWISQKYLRPMYVARLRVKFETAKPFPHLELASFLRKEKLAALRKALAREEFFEKRSDLFQLKQTRDFASASGILKEFREFLISREFIAYMTNLTGIRLSQKKIDLNGSLYEDTDYLLCHDDELDSRTVAFLFYLTDMRPSEGGSLNLFESSKKKPSRIAKKIIPKEGTLAFFAVSEKSFHEVEEMYVAKRRLTIGGWLHG